MVLMNERWEQGMYGTISRLRVQPGKDEELQAVSDAWTKTRGASTGQVAEYVFKLDNSPDEHMLVGIFRDRETYIRNASDPETDRWYRQLRELLVADPEWNDGEVVQSFHFDNE